MNDAIDLVFKFMDDLIPDIAKSQEEKGLKASGASALSLRVDVVDDKTARLIDGSGSFRFQDKPGRGPTQSSSSGAGQTLQSLIYDWLRYKKYGINYGNDKERISLSWAISITIHKKGNWIHRTGNQTNVVVSVVTSNRTALLREQVGTFYARKVMTGYLEAFKN